ncbi:MAG: DUF6264 family protein [Lacisediminihabitans sp.]
MTDSRPRPQYGEYASPEDQAKAIGIPLVHVPKTVPAAAPVADPVHSVEKGKEKDAHSAVASNSTATRAKRSRDTVATVMLLGLGLAWILISIPGTSDLAGTLNRTYALQGYTGKYGPVALASILGLVINISSLVLWGITCAVSIALIRRHRRAFYVPLIGGALSGLVIIALTIVAMFNDPGLLAHLSTLQG